MNTFIETLAERAKLCPKKVAFPETGNVDILRTAQADKRNRDRISGFDGKTGRNRSVCKGKWDRNRRL